MSDGPDLELRAFAGLRPFLSDGRTDDPRPYIAALVKPAAFASIMSFLAPALVEYRGAVLLGFAFERSVVDEWFARLGEVMEVERMVNHVHMWDLMLGDDVDETETERLLEPIAAFWRVALEREFPERRFVVDTVADGSYGPELTFFQDRGAP